MVPSSDDYKDDFLDNSDFRIFINGQQIWDDSGAIVFPDTADRLQFDVQIHNITNKPFWGIQCAIIIDFCISVTTDSLLYSIPLENAETLLLSKSPIRVIYPNSWATINYMLESQAGNIDDGFSFLFQLHTKKGVYNYDTGISIPINNRLTTSRYKTY